jgi:hypothetical protein
VIQVIATFGLGYAAVEVVMWGFGVSLQRGVLHLLLAGPAVFFGGLAIVRCWLVFVLALVRIADNMEDLSELPRWVRGLSPLRRLRPFDVARKSAAFEPPPPGDRSNARRT